jgi:hypothetical protein
MRCIVQDLWQMICTGRLPSISLRTSISTRWHAWEGQMYLTVNAICYTAFQQCD